MINPISTFKITMVLFYPFSVFKYSQAFLSNQFQTLEHKLSCPVHFQRLERQPLFCPIQFQCFATHKSMFRKNKRSSAIQFQHLETHTSFHLIQFQHLETHTSSHLIQFQRLETYTSSYIIQFRLGHPSPPVQPLFRKLDRLWKAVVLWQ